MANRSMESKVKKARDQRVALAMFEGNKSCYLFARKPIIPAYDPAMVKRYETPAKSTKPRYVTPREKPIGITKHGLVACFR